jgi:PDZ domain
LFPRYYRPMRILSSRNLARVVLVFAMIVVAGCAIVRTAPSPEGKPGAPEIPSGPRYDPAQGQDSATVAELRAAPPPKEPEVTTSISLTGDERLLNARGYVRIGTGYFPATPAEARAWALHTGVHVGADKVLIYPAQEAGAAGADSASRITFYVRYRLPFGATFRTLTPDEQHSLGSSGVELGEIVGGTPASEANLQKGDFVIMFDGKAFADRPAFERLLREHLGKRVTLTISRNGAVIERLVRLGVVAKPQGDSQK